MKRTKAKHLNFSQIEGSAEIQDWLQQFPDYRVAAIELLISYSLIDPSSYEHINIPRDLPYAEKFGKIGALPQGAATSPMLANLASSHLDETLAEYALRNGLVYTRYADDLTFSAREFAKSRGRIRSNIISLIRKSGFRENIRKTRIAGPGSKKVVLGLLVDGDEPRISKEFYRRVERLLYGTMKHGFGSAAVYNDFESAYGFHNHLSGLIAYIKSVDAKRWEEFSGCLQAIKRKWAEENIE